MEKVKKNMPSRCYRVDFHLPADAGFIEVPYEEHEHNSCRVFFENIKKPRIKMRDGGEMSNCELVVVE